MEQKAQASTEYLVILAVVIVVALVVVGLMGNFIGLGGETADDASKLYWKRAEIGLSTWIMDSDGADTIVVVNNNEYDIFLRNITIGDSTEGLNATVRSGSDKTIKKDWVSCEEDSGYSYEVSFTYDNAEFTNVTGYKFTGSQNIVGDCN